MKTTQLNYNFTFDTINGFFQQFPLVTHTHETFAKVHTIKDTKSFYNDLQRSFDPNTIFPLKLQDNKSSTTPKTLFLSSLELSSITNHYEACTPEDTLSLKNFLLEHNLTPPTQSLEETIDLDSVTTFCVVLMDINTLQIPLIIDSTTGSVIQDITQYEPKEEVEDVELLQEYKEKTESEITDKESMLKAYRTYSIALYLIILMNIPDLQQRLKYFECINESFLTRNNIFELLALHKCISLSKYVQLNISRKGPFMMEISLNIWSGINRIFNKTRDLERDVELIKLKYSNYKIFNKDVDDEVVNSVIECVNNNALLSKVRDQLEIKF